MEPCGTRAAMRPAAPTPQPRCPLRPDEPCTLCQLDVTGPQDCGLVYLVMRDAQLRQEFSDYQRSRLRRRPSL